MSVGNFMAISKSGSLLAHLSGPLEELKFKLPTDRQYSIGMDQSSSCTGFYLTDRETSFHLIGDMVPYGTDRHWFYAHMKHFISTTIREREIELFVREKTLPFGSGKHNAVLSALAKVIDHWRSEIVELKRMPASRFASIHVGTWKKHMVDPNGGKGHSRSKILMAEDILKLMPELHHFFRTIDPTSDFDAFDACGILHGYRAEHGILDADLNGKVAKIGGSAEYKGAIATFFIPVDELQNEDMIQYLGDFQELMAELSVEVLATNEEETWYANVKRAATYSPMTITTVTAEKHRVMLQWLVNFPNKNASVIAVIFRKSSLTGSMLKFLQSRYAHEIVSW